MNKLKKYTVSVLLLLLIFSCSNTKVIAHRGFSGQAPENTLAAFNKAIDVGADYIELDVRQTKDNVLVIMHDKTVNRTSSNNKTGEIKELYYQEVQEIKVGYSSKFGDTFKDERVPTLKETLLLAKNKIKLCVELKPKGIDKEVVEMISDLGMINQVIIFSFHKETLINVKKLNPKFKTLLLADYANLKSIDFAVEIGIDAIGVGYATTLTKEFIKSAHNKNIKIFKWTVNDTDHMKKLIGFKVDGIITNRPDIMLKIN